MQFYRSCMDTERIESQGAQPLKDLLNQVNLCAVSSPSGREFLFPAGRRKIGRWGSYSPT